MVPKLTNFTLFQNFEIFEKQSPQYFVDIFNLPGIGILIQILQYKGKKLTKAYVTWM